MIFARLGDIQMMLILAHYVLAIYYLFMIQCQVKLRISADTETQLNKWLRMLTDVHN